MHSLKNKSEKNSSFCVKGHVFITTAEFLYLGPFPKSYIIKQFGFCQFLSYYLC